MTPTITLTLQRYAEIMEQVRRRERERCARAVDDLADVASGEGALESAVNLRQAAESLRSEPAPRVADVADRAASGVSEAAIPWLRDGPQLDTATTSAEKAARARAWAAGAIERDQPDSIEDLARAAGAPMGPELPPDRHMDDFEEGRQLVQGAKHLHGLTGRFRNLDAID
jgi:hypothetical protein